MKKFFYLIITLFIVNACDTDNTSTIPSVKFTYDFDLTDEEFFDFTPGESIALTKYDYDDDDTKESIGYCGIIIYWATEKTFYAYDLCCPIHVDDKELLTVDGVLAYCPTDSVCYSLMTGLPYNNDYDGDVSCLRQYSTSYISSSNTLKVYN